MSRPGFWDNQETAQKVIGQLTAVRSVIEPVEKVAAAVKDLRDLFELAAEEKDAATLASIEKDLPGLNAQCEKIEIAGMLNGPDDMRNCFFSIHAGAGGTESCDWANMLLRMYTRYFDRNGYKYEELDITPGEEAGIRSITLRVERAVCVRASCRARRACIGWCGSARSIRQSRRHTSFAAVDVHARIRGRC